VKSPDYGTTGAVDTGNPVAFRCFPAFGVEKEAESGPISRVLWGRGEGRRLFYLSPAAIYLGQGLAALPQRGLPGSSGGPPVGPNRPKSTAPLAKHLLDGQQVCHTRLAGPPVMLLARSCGPQACRTRLAGPEWSRSPRCALVPTAGAWQKQRPRSLWLLAGAPQA